MSDSDNIFNGENNEVPETTPTETPAVEPTEAQPEVQPTFDAESENNIDSTIDPEADEIADKYAGAAQPPVQPWGAPQQPPYAPQQPAQPWGAQPPYRPQYQPPAYVPPQPSAPVYSQAGASPAKKKKGRAVFCAILAAVILIAGISIPIALKFGSNTVDNISSEDADKPTAVQGNENAPKFETNTTPSGVNAATGETLTPAQIYAKISPSIVAIMIYQNDKLLTEGTGIIMSVDSTNTYTYILTCAHLLNSAGTNAVVQTEDGSRYDAEIVGFDARTDIGVLRVKKTGFTVAEFGNSDALKVGDPIYAIGNPGGSEFFGTFTDGIVSAIGRTITSSIGYDMICIQHNAAISPGNSGGALVNAYGQVIGINSSKIAATEYEGISFAIPVTQAKDVIEKVSQYGYVPGRPKLGISYLPNNSSSVSSIYSMAVQMKGLPSGSLVIYSIDTDSLLRKTDVQAGDMIIAVNGKKMDKADVLFETIDGASVGDEITLTIFRISSSGGQYTTSQFDVKVKLIEETNKKSDEEQTTKAYQYDYNFGF